MKKSEWEEQIKAQQQSGLSAAEFCRKNQLPLKSFYHQRSRLSCIKKSPFVQAQVKPPSLSENISRDTEIILKRGFCQLHLPSNTSTSWLAQLMKGMS